MLVAAYLRKFNLLDREIKTKKAFVLTGVNVLIAEGSVIGAGSVVVKSIAKNSFAAGNPCHVIREITEKDSIYK